MNYQPLILNYNLPKKKMRQTTNVQMLSQTLNWLFFFFGYTQILLYNTRTTIQKHIHLLPLL